MRAVQALLLHQWQKAGALLYTGHDLDFFKKLKHARLKNRQILVTGVLRKYGKNRYIRVRHPAYLQILE